MIVSILEDRIVLVFQDKSVSLPLEQVVVEDRGHVVFRS